MRFSKSIGSAFLGCALIGVSGLTACGGGGDDEPGAVIEWLSTPATTAERGELVEAQWRVVSEFDISQSILLVCPGTVPECGLAGPDSIAYSVVATEADGVYTASIGIRDSGVFTLVAFADTGEGAYISPPMGVVVDQRAYPAGPYGYAVGDTIANFTLQGYRDTDADADDDPFNEEPSDITLESFFSGQDLDARVLLIQVSAGWCSVCQDETRSLRTMWDEYKGKGGRFYTVLFQDDNEDPAQLDDVKAWGEYFGTHWPHGADPTDSLSPYFPEPSVPLNIYVDLLTMKIVEVHVGFDSSYTRQILNTYVN
jgi:hypothetical protein